MMTCHRELVDRHRRLLWYGFFLRMADSGLWRFSKEDVMVQGFLHGQRGRVSSLVLSALLFPDEPLDPGVGAAFSERPE